jgi:catechol 2,3-dioxygenase-like lactoylglutathione lyase family enzyme
VTRVAQIRFVTAQPQMLEGFYRDVLGFEAVLPAPAFSGGDADAQRRMLRLGQQFLELVTTRDPGRPYPSDITANDLRFQHIAIVVSDMSAAYARLRKYGGWTPITRSGPQLLPPSSGGVTAFKFRDPEGHPVELSMFPPGVGAERWREPDASGNCLGIDHSALSVADPARSLAFYAEALGMSVIGRSLNRGPEQDRLDGLSCDGVDIVALQPADPASPHIELLGYPQPRRSGRRLRPNDIAATRLDFQVADLPGTVDRLRTAGARFVSPGAVTLATGPTALVADPDGHLLRFSE